MTPNHVAPYTSPISQFFLKVEIRFLECFCIISYLERHRSSPSPITHSSTSLPLVANGIWKLEFPPPFWRWRVEVGAWIIAKLKKLNKYGFKIRFREKIKERGYVSGSFIHICLYVQFYDWYPLYWWQGAVPPDLLQQIGLALMSWMASQ